MFSPLLRTVLAVSLLAVVAGCNQKSATDTTAASVASSATTPDAAIRRSAELLKDNDIAGFMQNSLPPAKFAKAKADWTKDANEKPITDEDRKKFADTMGKLTAPDAEQALLAEIEPKLAEFDAQYQQQIPMYVAMGSGWLQGMIQQNKDLSDESKQQAVAAIGALGAWVQKTRFTDPAAVKKVIAISVKTARALDLKTLDQARALGFDGSMTKAKIALKGFKEALAVYGFSLDQMLDSVKPEVTSNDGKTAKVKVAYTLLETPLTMETEMVNLDGRWYGKQAIEQLDETAAEPKDAPPSEIATAPVADPVPAKE